MNRRTLLRTLVGASAAGLFSRFESFAQAHRGKVKITGVRVMQIKNIAGNSMVKIDTDAGIAGYGEAGASGPMARSRIEQIKPMLIGQDPLSIERHFLNMISLMHPYMAHIPTISGIDIALWDIAGKITGQPVNVLLGGPFRDAIPLYSHGLNLKMSDPASCRDWAARIKSAPEGFNAYKIDVHHALGVPVGRYAFSIDGKQARDVARAYANVREAVGDSIDIAVHAHNELDTLSAIQVAKAVEAVNPLFYEDPLHVGYSDGWEALRKATRVPLLIGEKLELVQGFKPFLDHHLADIVHPDLAFAGGFTGARKIADYAMISRTPVALHNVGSLILCCASAHFGSAIHNFYRSESALGRPTRHVEQMAAGNPPVVKEGKLQVPAGPGIGFEPNQDYLRSQLMPGEEFWA
jgi:L-alanine-DL-glutamate epimerase-like enolase superfamily enzyme